MFKNRNPYRKSLSPDIPSSPEACTTKAQNDNATETGSVSHKSSTPSGRDNPDNDNENDSNEDEKSTREPKSNEFSPKSTR